MSDVIDLPKEGDVFQWRYADPDADDRPWGDYHCCSRIGIFHEGRIRDTYWQIGVSFSSGRSFGVEDFPKLILQFRGNLSDFEKRPEYDADYYDDADFLDLNHANSTRGNFYLRKGAKRSTEKMLTVARRKLEKAQSDERYAISRAEDARKVIAKIEAGETDVYL